MAGQAGRDQTDVMDPWQELDEAWREAFRQAWEALRTGNIPIGACAATPDGEIIHSARNRVADSDGPHGEIFGSALAHAETNVLARLPFRHRRDLILTTTLEPCLQCAAAIRLGPVATVRSLARTGTGMDATTSASSRRVRPDASRQPGAGRVAMSLARSPP
jgi:tRNA(Arg) A34 adenosine deaminase TadA